MASAVARYGSALFGWAIGRGTLSTSPFENVPTTPIVSRDRVLNDDEISAIWAATAKPGAFNGITRMLRLSGQRREEVSGLRWHEINPGLTTWTAPPNRAKMARSTSFR
jgi:integrase